VDGPALQADGSQDGSFGSLDLTLDAVFVSDVESIDVEFIVDAPANGETSPGCRDQTLTWDSNPSLWKAESVAFSPDGQFLAATIQKAGRIWRVADGAMTAFNDPCVMGGMSSVSYFPDGNSLAAASCGAVFTIWTGGVFKTRLDDVSSLYAISPDGATVATRYGDTLLKVVKIATDETLFTITSPDVEWALAFSPDGTELASGNADATVRLWDARSGDALATLAAGAAVMSRGLAISPSGKLVAALSTAGIELWSMEDRQPAGTIAVDPLATEFAFTPDSKSIIAGGASVGVYSVADLRLLYQMGERTYAVAVSPDGTRVAATGDTQQSLNLYCLR